MAESYKTKISTALWTLSSLVSKPTAGFVVSGRQSLDAESAATLVHAFVTFRVDYCKATVLTGSPKFTTDKLQRVMNSAARVVSNTR